MSILLHFSPAPRFAGGDLPLIHFESIQKETGKMTKLTEREEAALNAAKEKLDKILAHLSKEEQSTFIKLLLKTLE